MPANTRNAKHVLFLRSLFNLWGEQTIEFQLCLNKNIYWVLGSETGKLKLVLSFVIHRLFFVGLLHEKQGKRRATLGQTN